MYHTYLYVQHTRNYGHFCTQFWRSVSPSGHGKWEFWKSPGSNPASPMAKSADSVADLCLYFQSQTYFSLFSYSFVIYRCEKNYMRRRLQETFQLSPNTANSGFFSSLAAGHHPGGQIPSISVSVQTEPCMTSLNGNATTIPHTTSLIGNGGLAFQNGVNSNPRADDGVGGGRNNYATLPHPHHRYVSNGYTQMGTSQILI